ncbi:Mini-ribonuclease 3 [Clostridium hydrogeniformans]|uniref:Mini-ribonuclease 3 n=1 Tax=Clostridium hydrogeniformans TaxID=349933 RepID=UPI000489A707|nr:ribonuclease III domain-containing protein [Clostridium hydrogeniformans]
MIEDFNFQKYSNSEAKQLNSLSLAFVGDAIYEVYIRSLILKNNDQLSAHKLHVRAIGYVKAKAQSDIMKELEIELNEEELGVYKRGRNTKSHTVPKNADVRDYRNATGFEALVGYLYLTNQKERMMYILDRAVKIKLGI